MALPNDARSSIQLAKISFNDFLSMSDGEDLRSILSWKPTDGGKTDKSYSRRIRRNPSPHCPILSVTRKTSKHRATNSFGDDDSLRKPPSVRQAVSPPQNKSFTTFVSVLQTFPKFLQLPTELQLKIWHHACPKGRMVLLNVFKKPSSMEPYVRMYIPPTYTSLLQTCQISRELMLKKFPLCVNGRRKIKYYLDPESDIVTLDQLFQWNWGMGRIYISQSVHMKYLAVLRRVRILGIPAYLSSCRNLMWDIGFWIAPILREKKKLVMISHGWCGMVTDWRLRYANSFGLVTKEQFHDQEKHEELVRLSWNKKDESDLAALKPHLVAWGRTQRLPDIEHKHMYLVDGNMGQHI